MTRLVRHLCLLFVAATALAACERAAVGMAGDAQRTLTLGDGTQIRHDWDEAGPRPAGNDWVRVEVAGYQLTENKSGPGFAWTWTFTLHLRHSGVNLVAVSDVTDTRTLKLVMPGDGIFNNGKWLAQSAAIPVSGFHLPWLFRDGDSVRVMRFSIADISGTTRILYQPILFTHEAKQRLVALARASQDALSGT